MRALGFLLLGFAVAAGNCAFAQGRAPADDGARWYAIVAEDGAMLGHAMSEIAQRPGGRAVVEPRGGYLRELGGEPRRLRRRTVISEDSQGQVTSIVAELQSGSFRSRTEARIARGGAHIVRDTPSGRWTTSVVLPEGVRFDAGEALLRGWDAA